MYVCMYYVCVVIETLYSARLYKNLSRHLAKFCVCLYQEVYTEVLNLYCNSRRLVGINLIYLIILLISQICFDELVPNFCHVFYNG